MNEKSTGKLFKEPAIWPLIPPWWLLSSTDAAALLNIKPATLHSWRIRGHGPVPYPPMYLKPTQGRPLYYQYGALRSWAATRLGMAYSLEDQCVDFFEEVFPYVIEGTGSLKGRIEVFEKCFLRERKAVLNGNASGAIKLEHLHECDTYYARQPRRVGSMYVMYEYESGML